MAFDLTAVGGYGSGSLGDVENLFGVVINTVGAATNIDGDSIKLDAVYTGTYGTFKSGDEVLIVIEGALTFSDGVTAPDVKTYLGRYCVCKVTAFTTGTNTLTVNTDVSQKFFGNLPITKDGATVYPAVSGKIIVVTIPHYKNLTLNAGTTLTPLDLRNHGYGNILALKCSQTLTFNGGHIDLRDKGLPTTEADNRPMMTYETEEKYGTVYHIASDTTLYSGWENSDTKDRLILNVGDGAAFIIAKKMVCHADSRIGNIETAGVQFCRGAMDSNAVLDGKIDGITNVGGSTILICAGEIDNNGDASIAPEMIAKYRNSSSPAGKGRGLARCYIASKTKLRNDEGLYAYDCISTPKRITSTLNIKSFGDGSDNAMSNPAKQINNYATITNFVKAESGTGTVLTYSDMTTTGSAIFKIGAMVMFHFNHSNKTLHSGRFVIGKIIGMDATTITIDADPPRYLRTIEGYKAQLITIPQYTDFTLNIPYQSTLAYNGSKGGIFAIACSGTCDLSGGVINVENKGGGTAYGYNGLKKIGNAQDSDKLPIGQGHGSVFILAQNLIMNGSTRIGATYNGANSSESIKSKCFGGIGEIGKQPRTINYGGGYRGWARVGSIYNGYYELASARERFEWAFSHEKPDGTVINKYGYFKSTGCGGAGSPPTTSKTSSNGGYGSNGADTIERSTGNTRNRGGKQGAHIMIIADTITGFNQMAISTGGSGAPCWVGPQYTSSEFQTVMNGTAGYGGGGNCYIEKEHVASYSKSDINIGGGGGYNGGGGSWATNNSWAIFSGGGSSGWAFIYCNNVVNQDTTDTVVDY